MDSAQQLWPEIQSIDNHAMNSYSLIQISSKKKYKHLNPDISHLNATE